MDTDRSGSRSPAGHVCFRMLGPLEVTVSGRRVALGGVRPRAVVAVLLAAQGRTVPEATLIDALWGEAPPPAARNSLQSHVSRLRTALAREGGGDLGARLSRKPGGYRMRCDTDEVDVGRVESLLSSARAIRGASASSGSDAARAAAGARELAEALSYWRGAPLDDLVELPGWHESGLAATRTRLDELHERVRDELFEARLTAGWHAETVPELEQAAAGQPSRERIHRLLALALYRCDRQADALATLRRYRARLVDEAGLDPSADLVRLEQGMLAQDPVLAPPVPPEPVTPSATPTGSVRATGRPQPLPAVVTVGSFVGRAEDLYRVDAALRSSRLVTITGPGGVGKTRLAVEWLNRLQTAAAGDAIGSMGSGGTVLLELAALRRGDAVASALATLLDVHAGAVPVQEAVLQHLAGRRLLLVLDNCEHLVDDVAELVQQILLRAADVRVLATSRERLGVGDEQVLPLAPLEVPGAGGPAPSARPVESPEIPSVRLFAERAVRAQPGFAMTEWSRPLVEELCRRLDGLPLAIELAAGQLGSIGLADLRDRLGDRLGLLQSGARRRAERRASADRPVGDTRSDAARHATLRAVVDWSYALLADDERAVFETLSVFDGGFTLEAAERVVGAVNADCRSGVAVAGVLARLVDSSLVTVVDAGDSRLRYGLLESVRAYAAERLGTGKAEEDAESAHTSWVLDLVGRAEPGLEGPDEVAWARRLDDELANVRSAWHRAVDGGDLATASHISGALVGYAQWHGQTELWTWARRLAELADRIDPPLRAEGLGAGAHAAIPLGDLDLAERLARAGLGVDASDPRRLSRTALTVVAMYRGRYDEVERFGWQAYHAGCSPLWGLIVLGTIALGRLYRGDVAGARTAVGWCRRRAAEVGCPTGLAWACYLDGEVAQTDDPARAAAALEHAVDLAGSAHSTFVAGVATVSLASVATRTGDRTRALRAFPEAVRHWQRAGIRVQQWTTLRILAELLADLDADEHALLLLAAADAAADAPAVTGADLDRLENLRIALRSRVGAADVARVSARAAALTPSEVVDYALDVALPAVEAVQV